MKYISSVGGGIHCDRCGTIRLTGKQCPHCRNIDDEGFRW